MLPIQHLLYIRYQISHYQILFHNSDIVDIGMHAMVSTKYAPRSYTN